MLALTAALLAAGAHPPLRDPGPRDRAVQDAIARAQAWIGDRAPDEFRRNLQFVSLLAIQAGTIYRACVPNVQNTKSYCVIVNRSLPLEPERAVLGLRAERHPRLRHRLSCAARPDIKRAVLVASILGSGIVFLDQTVVNVALPAIRASLHGSLADQQWVVEAYLLTLASLLLLGGSLGDVLGRRRVFTTGLVGFGVCSLACALAPSNPVLIAARGLQGIAGALLVPSTLALIVDHFGPGERAAAIGTWTAWTGVATVIGPLGGGALVQAASWRWIFVINVIPVAITVWLLRRLPADDPSRGKVDWIGALLCVLGLGGPVFGLIEQPRYGFGDPRVAVPIVGGLILLVAFVPGSAAHPSR